jgi:DNA-binding transcriptional LysR family regulator
MKNLQGLLAFVETAQAGSLRAAADRLDITPAAVSKNLARLEDQLGVRLIQRSTRRLAVTAEGERFLDKARAALRQLDEAVADVSQSAREASGRVRLSVGIAFGRRWVLPALPRIAAAHPNLQFEVDLDNRPVDLVAERYDIGIRGGVIPDSSLVARRVCALPVVLLASPAYLARAGVPRTPQELDGHLHAVVRHEGTGVAPWRFRRGRGRPLDVLPHAGITCSDPESLIEVALAQGGIVQTGLHHALPYLRSGRLKLLLHDCHDAGQREVVLHYPHRQYLAPRVRVVVDGLLQHLAAAPDLHLDVAAVVAAHPACVAAPR